MILVILGTQDKKFYRILNEIERLLNKGLINDKVIVQAGISSDFYSKKMKIFDLIPMDDFDALIDSADIIISHGGVGSIITSLKKRKKVIAIPRLKKYGEHVNDHQTQIVNSFTKDGYLLSLYDEKEIYNTLKRISDFEPKVFKSNTDNMISLIRMEIDN